jgi:hypothetical protein
MASDYCKRSAISYQLSAISYQLSAISYQLSAISYQLSAISYQLNEQIQKDLQRKKVDHVWLCMLNPLFLQKADCW